MKSVIVHISCVLMLFVMGCASVADQVSPDPVVVKQNTADPIAEEDWKKIGTLLQQLSDEIARLEKVFHDTFPQIQGIENDLIRIEKQIVFLLDYFPAGPDREALEGTLAHCVSIRSINTDKVMKFQSILDRAWLDFELGQKALEIKLALPDTRSKILVSLDRAVADLSDIERLLTEVTMIRPNVSEMLQQVSAILPEVSITL